MDSFACNEILPVGKSVRKPSEFCEHPDEGDPRVLEDVLDDRGRAPISEWSATSALYSIAHPGGCDCKVRQSIVIEPLDKFSSFRQSIVF